MTHRASCRIAAITAAAVLGNSCSGLRLTPYPETSPEQAQARSVAGELAAGATIIGRDLGKMHFGTDLGEAEIVPVLLTLENRSSKSSFIVLPENVTLDGENALVNGADLHQNVAPFGAAEATANVGFGLILVGVLVLPLLVAGVLTAAGATRSYSRAMEIRHALVVNEFGAATLSPGARAQGMLYFDAGSEGGGRSPNKQRALRISALRVHDGRPVNLRIALDAGDAAQ